MRTKLILPLLLLSGLLWPGNAVASSLTFSNEELIRGFGDTVFGLEYRSWSWQPYLVKKFAVPVRFEIYNLAHKDRMKEVVSFIDELARKVPGTQAALASQGEAANFQVFVVDRYQYASVVKADVYGDEGADAPGRCLVRVISDKTGISAAAAVIVSDEGDFLFKRCLVEELLQGLGPMNDSDELQHSVFNDESRHNRFMVFDQILLNMLYDPRIKPGMTRSEVEPLLQRIIRDVRHSVESSQ